MNEIERNAGDAATLRGFIKEYGCTPSMMASRAESAEQSLSSARAEAVRMVKDRIDLRMNNHLIEMSEGYDDSITGFNEAWDVVRSVLADMGGDDAKRG